MEYDRDLIFYFLLPFLVLAEGDMDGSIFWPAEISGEGMGKEKEWTCIYTGCGKC